MVRFTTIAFSLFAVLLLGVFTLFTSQTSRDTPQLSADEGARRRGLEARWLMRSRQLAAAATHAARAGVASELALANGLPAVSLPAQAVAAPTPALAAAPTLAVGSSSLGHAAESAADLGGYETTATTAAARAAAGCEGDRRPYHTVLTSSSGLYQVWQCRIMFHHWKLQKSVDPCGEMGGFTRLLTSRERCAARRPFSS